MNIVYLIEEFDRKIHSNIFGNVRKFIASSEENTFFTPECIRFHHEQTPYSIRKLEERLRSFYEYFYMEFSSAYKKQIDSYFMSLILEQCQNDQCIDLENLSNLLDSWKSIPSQQTRREADNAQPLSAHYLRMSFECAVNTYRYKNLIREGALLKNLTLLEKKTDSNFIKYVRHIYQDEFYFEWSDTACQMVQKMIEKAHL